MIYGGACLSYLVSMALLPYVVAYAFGVGGGSGGKPIVGNAVLWRSSHAVQSPLCGMLVLYYYYYYYWDCALGLLRLSARQPQLSYTILIQHLSVQVLEAYIACLLVLRKQPFLAACWASTTKRERRFGQDHFGRLFFENVKM